jgi:hypothetical protein
LNISKGNIVSVSRRTDVPAFYGDWFMRRIKEGYVGYLNPFGGQKYLVSLDRHDVIAFVFWSKDFGPFLNPLDYLDKTGYCFYFNFTITGLPGIFEPPVALLKNAISDCKELARRYSPKSINWRYDPIVVSDITPREHHVGRFAYIAGELEGAVERCYFSFVHMYGKVKRNLEKLRRNDGIVTEDPAFNLKRDLAERLAEIGGEHGIALCSCCDDRLLSENVKKASCVDAELVTELFYESSLEIGRRPTREDCGCSAGVDIGAYDTCPHGCVYCYANANKELAFGNYEAHDPSAPFLGYPIEVCAEWLSELGYPESPQNRFF